MAEQEKTEKATDKKLRDAHKKGQLPRSRALGLAAVSVVVSIALGLFGERLLGGLAERVAQYLGHFGDNPLKPLGAGDLTAMVITSGILVADLVGPIALAAMVAGIASQGIQGGWVFSAETLQFNWSRLNPINNAKRFGISKAGVDTLQTYVSVAVITWLGWRSVKAMVEQGVQMAWITPEASALVAWRELDSLLWQVAWALVALAVLDYGLQYFRFMQSMKMSKQEIRAEHKQQEGSPEVKGRIRRIQREMARQRMLNDVKRATVVVTNPTHFAVALEYRRGTMAAPMVLAKGADYLALAIRERAREHGIPIVENKPLAQSLYKTAEVGQFIPGELFTAVAEVLAQLIRLKQLTLH